MRLPCGSRLVFAAASIALGGCDSGDETDRIRLVPVRGTVTHDGKPLEGALVSFVPADSNKDLAPGGGATGPQGDYRAMFRGRSGLAPGKYRVMVSQTSAPPAAKPSNDEDPYMTQLSLGRAAGKQPAAALLEASYEREVDGPGAVLDFDLKEDGTRVPESRNR